MGTGCSWLWLDHVTAAVTITVGIVQLLVGPININRLNKELNNMPTSTVTVAVQ
jgi:hypothetical protein